MCRDTGTAHRVSRTLCDGILGGNTAIRKAPASIEEGTDNVPHDGRYYVVERGVIQKSYKHLKDAVGSYEELKGVRLAAESADTADVSAALTEEPSPSHD